MVEMSLKLSPQSALTSGSGYTAWDASSRHDINSARLAQVPPAQAAAVTQPAQLIPIGGPRPIPHISEEKSVQPAPDINANQAALDSRARDRELIALVERIAQADQTALATLYDTTNRLVYGLILRVLNDQGAAEEVLLDVYTQVWRQAANYDTGRGSPLAWLTTIARSRAIDRLRSGWQTQQRQETLDAVTDKETVTASPEEASVMSERQRIVRQALAQLSTEQREVIELAYYSGLSHSEIAAKLGQPLGTVKTRTRLGMMKLRDALGPLLGS
jgi:RNA polymerase sigma-70 factor (ECF subfamily)